MQSVSRADALPPLAGIRYIGDLPVAESKAVGILDLAPGTPFDADTVQAAAQRLADYLRYRHYPLATVGWQAEEDETGRMLVTLDVHAGIRGRLRLVSFEGNHQVHDSVLKSVTAVQAGHGVIAKLLGRDILRLEDLVADQARLEDLYHTNGYLDADVHPARLTWEASLDGYQIVWPIEEGNRYQWGEIRFEADLLPPPAQLGHILGIEKGLPVRLPVVASARERLAAYFLERGYAFSTIEVLLEPVRESGMLNLVFKIAAGEPVALRTIRITGNQRTHERVIRREILAREGDRFNALELQMSQANLLALPLFADVAMSYQPVPDAALYDLEVNVRERNTGRAELAFIYDPEIGGAAQFVLRESNLALRPPFRGQALQAELKGTFGDKITRGDVVVRNPRLGHSFWRMDSSVFHEDSSYRSDLYNQRSHGASLLLGHPLGTTHLLRTGYEIAGYALYDIDERFAESLSSDIPDIALTSWVGIWDMDRTDWSFRPAKGFKARASVQVGSHAFGGDIDLVQSDISFSFFYNPYGQHVTSLRGGYETLAPYGKTDETPQQLRLFLGGTSNLRGFGYQTLAPRNEAGYLEGGQTAWWLMLEHLVPVSRRLDLAIYAGIGDVSTESYAVSGIGPFSDWGIGILIRADNFPARFDVAFPLNTIEEDTFNKVGSARLSFSLGYQY